MGGKAATALNAASMALQNTPGMICDPVADRVEVPCLWCYSLWAPADGIHIVRHSRDIGDWDSDAVSGSK